MATTVRFGVFETNSSSTHSIMILSPQQYNAWASGEIVYDWYNGDFVDAEYAAQQEKEDFTYMDGEGFISLNDFNSGEKKLRYLETEVYPAITPGGENIYIATYYGRI